MIVRKRSWPAVSHICSLTRLPSSSIVRILKSMPMVVMNDGVKESSLKRSRQHDFPTPESPMSRSFIYTWTAPSQLAHHCGHGPESSPLLHRRYCRAPTARRRGDQDGRTKKS